MRSISCALIVVVLLCSVAERSSAADDPLPSWNETARKKRIIALVEAVTDAKAKSYVKPEDRIATFDHDGTLWCEKPNFIHSTATFERFRQLVAANPELAKQQPYKAVVANEATAYFHKLNENKQTDTVISDLFGVAFAGTTVSEYETWNRRWLATWKHPRFHVGYRRLVYLPMVELIRYLDAHDFEVYICTADEAAFVQLVSGQLYGIPQQGVLGSSTELKYEVKDGRAQLVRTKQPRYFSIGDGKARLIFQTLAKRPILAAGNTNGDLQMLQYAARQDRPSLSLLVHHTDARREYAYDKNNDKVLPMAEKNDWAIVDMAKDWKTIFPK